MSESPRHAVRVTARDVRNILGPVDNELVIAIQHSGASIDDVRQAKGWLDDDDHMGADLHKSAHDAVRRVHELLREDLEGLDED